jgi:hypothetical protein
MRSCPVVSSTVPVMSAATLSALASPRMVAARSCTAVLPNSDTGSGSVTVELGEPVAVVLMALSWIVAVDWYFGVWILA